MITLSYFTFAVILFLALMAGAGFVLGFMEVMKREIQEITKPEPEAICTECHLLFTKSGQQRALPTGHCARCEAREILNAAKDVGERQRKERVEKHFEGGKAL